MRRRVCVWRICSCPPRSRSRSHLALCAHVRPRARKQVSSEQHRVIARIKKCAPPAPSHARVSRHRCRPHGTPPVPTFPRGRRAHAVHAVGRNAAVGSLTTRFARLAETGPCAARGHAARASTLCSSSSTGSSSRCVRPSARRSTNALPAGSIARCAMRTSLGMPSSRVPSSTGCATRRSLARRWRRPVLWAWICCVALALALPLPLRDSLPHAAAPRGSLWPTRHARFWQYSDSACATCLSARASMSARRHV